MNRFFTTGIAIALLGTAQAQLVVDPSLTPTQLVQDVLLGSGVTVSNITYNGVAQPPTAQPGSASFTQVGDLGIDAGVLLSTGFPASAIGPSTNFSTDDLGNNGNDPDLEAIMGGNLTNFSILEFDFVPVGDSVKFNYVFGSEEYPSFVCSYNDAFGFFLSGPGIAGPYTNGAVNIAVLPDGVTPVTIANVNSGQGNDPNDPTCPAVNPEYYVNNSAGQTIAYGGMTVVLTAKAAVQCGQTYHIKLAVADAGGNFGDTDTAYDSGVFLEGGSFTSAPFIPMLTPGPGIVGNTMFENCYDMHFSFLRVGDFTEADTFQVSYSGTFTNGEDIVPPLPTEVIFAAGENTSPFAFNAPIDGDAGETVIITVVSISCIGEPTENVFEFNIQEAPALIAVGGSTTIACGASTTLTANVTGGYTPYTYEWPDQSTGNTLVVSPTAATTYQLEVTDTCGTRAVATFEVGLLPPPPINVSLLGPNTITEACESTTINIIRPISVQGEITLDLSFAGGTNGVDFDMPAQRTIPDGVLNLQVPFQPLEDGVSDDGEATVVTVSFTDPCGRTVSGSVTITTLDAPEILVSSTGDMLVECSPDSIPMTATASGGYGGLSLSWSTGAIGPEAYGSGMLGNTYVVTATDACGRTATASTTIIVDCEIIVPNVFTPNNDGQNDRFVVEGIMSTTNTVRIFNRWGQVVFEANNYRNNWGANGIPEGTYFYEIVVERHDKPYTGHLTILRN